MILDSNFHSVFSLYYHLVLVVKYRRNILDDIVSDFVKEMFIRIGSSHHIPLYNMYRSLKYKGTIS